MNMEHTRFKSPSLDLIVNLMKDKHHLTLRVLKLQSQPPSPSYTSACVHASIQTQNLRHGNFPKSKDRDVAICVFL